MKKSRECKYCGTILSKNTKICSNCGKKNKSNTVSWLLTIFMAFSGLSFFPSVTSIFMFGFVAICAPIPFTRSFFEKYKIKGLIRTIVLIVLFILSMITTPDNLDSNLSNPEPTSSIESIADTSHEVPTTQETTQPPETTVEYTEEATTVPATSPEPELITEPIPDLTTIPEYEPATVETIPETTTAKLEESSEEMVWIPTNGGRKYHTNQWCSGMDNPQEVTISRAKAKGFTACKRCY